MQLSVIIVTYNSIGHIGACLDSIQKKTRELKYEVIVVDNASSDGTAELIEQEYPWVTLIRNNKNLGFGTANNRGAEQATGEVLAIINDDTLQTENALKAAYDTIKDEETFGVLGFHLTYADGSHQDSVRRFPAFWDQAMILKKLHRVFPNAKRMQRYLATDFDYSREQDVEQLMGACMILRREVFEESGGFDERFFVWFEEVDLQKRIQEDQGLRTIYSPTPEMVHIKSASFGKQLSTTNQKMFNKSMRQYFFKHHGWWPTIILVMIQPYALFLAWVVQLLKLRK